MGNDGLKIRPEDLKVAESKARDTAQASTPKPAIAPVTAGTSPIDAAAHMAAMTITTLKTVTDAADMGAAATQMAALTESPPVLEQQDKKGADDMVVAGQEVEATKFPIATVSLLKSGGTTSA